MNTMLLVQNLRSAIHWLRASFALAVLAGREPERIPVPVPVRRASPYARVIACTLGLSLVALAPQANAAQWWPAQNTHVRGQLVDVQMVVGGQAAPLFQRRGQIDRSYFEAFTGRNYSINLRNLTGERIGVLITVDGLNVVNGERTGLGSHESMYVLDPWESTSIRGWRSSLDEVRRFVFVDEERSYASRTNQANGDMGWIRVVTFRENRPISTWGKIKSGYRDGGGSDGAVPYNSSPTPPSGEESRTQERAPRSAQPDAAKDYSYNHDESAPGTGWGERSRDPVNRTVFNANAYSSDMIVLRYEYESGLRALGIFPRRDRNRTWEREQGDLGFAKPPRW
jgi:hypothetical protein